MYLATAQEMNAWDTATIEMGMPAFSLMENASREIWHVLREIFVKNGQPLQDKRILILAGGGNNGGDAIALARLLHDAQDDKSHILVVHTHPLEAYKGMAQDHVQLAKVCGVPFMSAEDWLSATERGGAPFVDVATSTYAVPHIIIDGLLGTGFQGPLRGNTLTVIERLTGWLDGQNIYGQSKTDNTNEYLHHTQQSALFNPLAYTTFSQQQEQTSPLPCPYILAIDSPSGIDSTTGAPSPLAITAHATVTFEAPKIGLVLEPARPYVGNLIVRSIGIPSVIQRRLATENTLLHHDITRFLPDMNKLGHKGDAGHVLVIGGSQSLTGAAHLSAKAALRTGAGLVSMAVPSGLEVEAKCATPDIMVMGVGNTQTSHQHQESHTHFVSAIYNEGHWPNENLHIALRDVLDLATRCKALVLGPGIGRSVEALAVVKMILSMPKRPPAIIDADALFALSHHAVLPASHREALYGQSLSSLPPNPLLALVQKHDILTPHPTEAARMLNWTTNQVQADRMGALKKLTQILAGTVILKGTCTLIGQAQKSSSTTVSPFIEPHLSVAGSGDALAGMIASLVAQGVMPTIAAQLGVFLHVKTGALLAQQFPKRGNMASDMIEIIPQTLLPL